MIDSAAGPRLREPRQRVSPRARLMWASAAALEAVALVAALVMLGPVTGWLPIPVRAVALVAVAAAAYVVAMPLWRYRVHRWEVTGDVVYTLEGWLNRTWQLVPVARIQTVDHTQGWLERLFGLATLKIQTASHAGSSTIEGLAEDQARRLAEELAARAGELRDDAT